MSQEILGGGSYGTVYLKGPHAIKSQQFEIYDPIPRNILVEGDLLTMLYENFDSGKSMKPLINTQKVPHYAYLDRGTKEFTNFLKMVDNYYVNLSEKHQPREVKLSKKDLKNFKEDESKNYTKIKYPVNQTNFTMEKYDFDMFKWQEGIKSEIKVEDESETKIFSERMVKIYYDLIFYLHNRFHKSHIIHGDLKPENVMLNSTSVDKEFKNFKSTLDKDIHFDCKIIDHGLAQRIFNNQPRSDQIQTMWYRAPEVILRYPYYDERVDVWSLGVMMLFSFFDIFISMRDELNGGGSNEINFTKKEGKFNALSVLTDYIRVIGLPSSENWNKIVLNAISYVSTKSVDSEDLLRFLLSDDFTTKNTRNFNKLLKTKFEKKYEKSVKIFGQQTIDLVCDLIDSCLKIDFYDRPHSVELLKHPLFISYHLEIKEPLKDEKVVATFSYDIRQVLQDEKLFSSDNFDEKFYNKFIPLDEIKVEESLRETIFNPINLRQLIVELFLDLSKKGKYWCEVYKWHENTFYLFVDILKRILFFKQGDVVMKVKNDDNKYKKAPEECYELSNPLLYFIFIKGFDSHELLAATLLLAVSYNEMESFYPLKNIHVYDEKLRGSDNVGIYCNLNIQEERIFSVTDLQTEIFKNYLNGRIVTDEFAKMFEPFVCYYGV